MKSVCASEEGKKEDEMRGFSGEVGDGAKESSRIEYDLLCLASV
jgi:hypothetical protein